MILLTTLGDLTNLRLSTPRRSEARKLKLWDIQELFQQNSFHLQQLHFEFKLDGDLAVASMPSTAADSEPGDHVAIRRVQIPVDWSPEPISVKPIEIERDEHLDFSDSDKSLYGHDKL